MKHEKKQLFIVIMLILLYSLVVSSCSNSNTSDNSNGNGTLNIRLTDASTAEYKAVYVTLKEIRVLQKSHESSGETNIPEETDTSETTETDSTETGTADNEDGEWVVVASPNKTYNLLELVNGITEKLGSSELAAGEYDEMRLVLGNIMDDSTNLLGESHPYGNYVIDAYENIYELVLPDDYEQGYKINDGFSINEDSSTDLLLDFNVVKSIIQAGSDGKWRLNATVTVLDEDVLSEVSGFVIDIATSGYLEGVLVSAQQSDGSNTEIVVASTISDESGGYTLMLAPGVYTIVTSKTGYDSAASEVTVESGVNSTLDFSLAEGDGEGTITGTVVIDDGEDGQFISISIRKKVEEGGVETIVEVASLSVANGGQYTFDLPAGTYSMVSAFVVDGIEMTLESGDSFIVTDGSVIEFDIIFSNIVSEEGDDNCSEGKECEKPKKVTVCHKGREICISEHALKAHLRHGDTEGSCSEDPLDDASDESTEDTVDDTAEVENGKSKVRVCHKGRILRISESALEMHLNHGDVLESCDTFSDENSDDTEKENGHGSGHDSGNNGNKDKEKNREK